MDTKYPGGADISPYAAAARAEDVSNLPPAYILVGTPELFLDENFTYAQRLIAAGGSTQQPRQYSDMRLIVNLMLFKLSIRLFCKRACVNEK